MQNGRKVYKHDYSDSVFPSEKVARDDERMKKPVTTQKLRTFGGKSSDVQQSKNMDIVSRYLLQPIFEKTVCKKQEN